MNTYKEAIKKYVNDKHQINLFWDMGMLCETDKHEIALYPFVFQDGRQLVQLSIQTKHEDGTIAIREIPISAEAMVSIWCTFDAFIRNAVKDDEECTQNKEQS